MKKVAIPEMKKYVLDSMNERWETQMSKGEDSNQDISEV